MRKKILSPTADIPANDDTRAGFHAGPGQYQGKAFKARIGRVRDSSVISPPKDKTAGFRKNITVA